MTSWPHGTETAQRLSTLSFDVEILCHQTDSCMADGRVKTSGGAESVIVDPTWLVGSFWARPAKGLGCMCGICLGFPRVTGVGGRLNLDRGLWIDERVSKQEREKKKEEKGKKIRVCVIMVI